MPIAVTTAPYRPVPLDAPRKRWTREELAALESSGLMDQEKLELVDGELISTMGKKRPHVSTHAKIMGWLVRTFGDDFVNSEAPIDVAPDDNPTNEPEPDLIVLRKPTYEIQSNPEPADIRLAIEISNTTLGFDLTTKAALYARAGIVEYWVFDVQERRLIVHRDPYGGAYRSIAAYGEQENVAPLASPGAAFRVGQAFGA